MQPALNNPYLVAFNKIAEQGRYTSYDYDQRRQLVKQYAWAVPNDEAIATLTSLSPIIEVGAGSGYWASLVRQAGGVIYAFDTPVGNSAYAFDAKHAPISVGAAEITSRYPNHTLFICWPPYDNDFASLALRNYTGNTVVYVGEWEGGCTANKEFFQYLTAKYTETACVAIPQWEGLHDRLYVYTRKAS